MILQLLAKIPVKNWLVVGMAFQYYVIAGYEASRGRVALAIMWACYGTANLALAFV